MSIFLIYEMKLTFIHLWTNPWTCGGHTNTEAKNWFHLWRRGSCFVIGQISYVTANTEVKIKWQTLTWLRGLELQTGAVPSSAALPSTYERRFLKGIKNQTGLGWCQLRSHRSSLLLQPPVQLLQVLRSGNWRPHKKAIVTSCTDQEGRQSTQRVCETKV